MLNYIEGAKTFREIQNLWRSVLGSCQRFLSLKTLKNRFLQTYEIEKNKIITLNLKTGESIEFIQCDHFVMFISSQLNLNFSRCSNIAFLLRDMEIAAII